MEPHEAIYELVGNLNTSRALLEECVVNGNKGAEALYAWFLSERCLIEYTIENSKEE